MITLKLDRVKQIQLALCMNELLTEEMLRISKRQLLSLVGYVNDAAGAWRLVGEAFSDVGGDVDKLRGIELANGIVLLMVGEPDPISEWS